MKIVLRTLTAFVLTISLLVTMRNTSFLFTSEDTGSITAIAKENTDTIVATENADVMISELYTDKASYNPGDIVKLTINLVNNTSEALTKNVHLSITHLESSIYEKDQLMTVDGSGSAEQTINWVSPENDYTGYLVKISLENGQSQVTAIDVSSDFTRYPRYGYSVDFPVGETAQESNNIIKDLARQYHINAVQYYDWMYRHEKDIPDTGDTWVDMFGNNIAKSSITQRIDAGHIQNQKALAYQMAYMAREGYEDYGVKKQWGLYKNKKYNTSYNPSDISTISNLDQLNFPLEGNPPPILNVFNPLNSDWQSLMSGQYKDAVNVLGFDGIQIDQMGNFWGNIDYFDYYGNYVDLGKSFSSFVNNAKDILTSNNPEKNYITMNMVNGGIPEKDAFSSWDITKNANCDFEFSELWQNSSTYDDIKKFVDWQRSNDGGKTMVLAAYMNQYDNNGSLYEAESGNINGLTTGNDGGLTYVSGFDQTGDSVEFTVSAPEEGSYALVFHYANGSDARATKNIYVDSSLVMKANFDLTRTGLLPAPSSWSTYSYEAAFTDPKLLYLTKGNHTIRIQQDTDSVGDIRLDSLSLGTFDDSSVRLTDSSIAASGAMHIEMGTGLSMANGDSKYSEPVMLGHPYYPKAFKVMRNDLRQAIKAHYNFITSYENLLYDSDVMSSDEGLQNLKIEGQPVSGSGEAGKIWFIPKNKGDDYGIIHLINLTSETDTDWRNSTPEPAALTNLGLKYYIPDYKSVESVYLASPDSDGGASTSLSFSMNTDSNGKYIQFSVPLLKYWDMIYFKWGGEGTPKLIEAENSIISGVNVNSNHPGFTGTGFVDQFGEVNDSVSTDVIIPKDGTYTFKFRFANATGAECSRALYIDNQSSGKVTFFNGSSWDSWQISEKGVSLKAGQHRIVLLVTNQYGGFINLDNISVEGLSESARALYMNNWQDTNYIWKDTETNRAQTVLNDGPSIYEMRYYDGTATGDYNANQIKNYSMFFRDETSNIAYTHGDKYRSTGYFDDNGVLINNYDTYDGSPLSPKITRSYAVIPNEKFMIVKYSITNTENVEKQYSLLDMLHVNNNSNSQIQAQYDAADKVIKYNMSSSGQYYIAHGYFGNIDEYQVANDSDTDLNSITCSPWVSYNKDGTLKGNSSVSTQDISSGYKKIIDLAPGTTQNIFFYTSICGSQSELDSTIQRIKTSTPQQWIDSAGSKYMNWLDTGKKTNLKEARLNKVYNKLLITLKQSIVPGKYVDDGGATINKFAAMPATTNPSAYSYKIWARDSAVTAMSLDASGHVDEAESYWHWLADRQIKTDQGDWKKPGAFWTCYWIWDNSPVSFVEPEYDSIGMFLVGAYRHYIALPDEKRQKFLDDIWEAYKLSADLVQNSVNATGFGASDSSIWEEQNEYNTFTQGLYVAGLDAAQKMALFKNMQELADGYSGAASTIRSAIQRSTSDSQVGLYNQTDSDSNWWYYNRAVNLDGTPRNTVDSSSDILFSYGVLDMASKRAYNHYRKIVSTIGHDEYGIARYQGDTFYTGINSWDPGGAEALENEPSWPQMTMWIALMEKYSGYEALYKNGIRRLDWYVDRMAEGFMSAGEAVSNITYKPMISTAIEPITAASYIIAALVYDQQFDMRVTPSQYNAGANQSIVVHDGCIDTSDSFSTVADWQQWKYVPYYKDDMGDNSFGDASRDIGKVYIANDDNNIYIRIDNYGKKLPEFNDSGNEFSISLYTEDIKHQPGDTIDTSVNGSELHRNLKYAFVRKSDSNNFSKMSVSGGNWVVNKEMSGLSPQWEPDSGRIEMVIPKSELSSTNIADYNDWGNMVIVLGTNESGQWKDADIMNIHYRITAPDTAWIFGDSEQ